ncbi:MAG: hypothetical protein ACRYG7_54685 [Janthinobacterium lividum]
MALSTTPDNTGADNSDDPTTPDPKKKGKNTTAQTINPIQYRAVRFVSFMLEDTKHEITPESFLKEAIARHLVLYQTKRGIEFPNKMLAELTKLDLIPSKGSSEE